MITVVVGIVVAFILASVPSKAKWLTEEERRLAAWRLQCDAAGEADEGGETSMKKGLWLVIKDWKVSPSPRQLVHILLADISATPSCASTNVHLLRSILHLFLPKYSEVPRIR